MKNKEAKLRFYVPRPIKEISVPLHTSKKSHVFNQAELKKRVIQIPGNVSTTTLFAATEKELDQLEKEALVDPTKKISSDAAKVVRDSAISTEKHNKLRQFKVNYINHPKLAKGNKYNEWTIVGTPYPVEKPTNTRWYVECSCSCGKTVKPIEVRRLLRLKATFCIRCSGRRGALSRADKIKKGTLQGPIE